MKSPEIPPFEHQKAQQTGAVLSRRHAIMLAALGCLGCQSSRSSPIPKSVKETPLQERVSWYVGSNGEPPYVYKLVVDGSMRPADRSEFTDDRWQCNQELAKIMQELGVGDIMVWTHKLDQGEITVYMNDLETGAEEREADIMQFAKTVASKRDEQESATDDWEVSSQKISHKNITIVLQRKGD